jgi:hypothetical protein
MKQCNEIEFNENKNLILSCLPGTLSELTEKSMLHENTVRSHLKILLLENEIHVCDFMKIGRRGGRKCKVYKKGPKPSVVEPPVIIKHKDIIPKPDKLTTAFFGLTGR